MLEGNKEGDKKDDQIAADVKFEIQNQFFLNARC